MWDDRSPICIFLRPVPSRFRILSFQSIPKGAHLHAPRANNRSACVRRRDGCLFSFASSHRRIPLERRMLFHLEVQLYSTYFMMAIHEVTTLAPKILAVFCSEKCILFVFFILLRVSEAGISPRGVGEDRRVWKIRLHMENNRYPSCATSWCLNRLT